MENVYKYLDEVILCIKSSQEYQMCISLKNKMSNNDEVIHLIEEVKRVQKQYIRSGYDKELKKELDRLNHDLDEIPIYVIYKENLNIVNEKIDMVRDYLNDYFYQLLNKKY